MIDPNRKPIRRRKTYDQWANAMAKKWGISRQEFNSHPYDYYSYFNDNEDEAWEHVYNKMAPNLHFPDKYKTASHPTFSKESIYSEKFGIHNPSGIQGGTWARDDNYVFSTDQMQYGWPIDKTARYVNGEDVKLYSPLGKRLLPKYRSGKDDNQDVWHNGNQYTYNPDTQRYYDSANNPVQFMQGGMLPEAVVTPSTRQRLDHPLVWKDVVNGLYTNTDRERAVRNTTATTEALNAITGGVLNRISPTQNLRFGYDLLTGNFADAGRSFVYGNNGVVSDSFAQQHPYWSMLINGAADVGVIGGLGSGRQLNRLVASSENPNIQYLKYRIGKTNGLPSRSIKITDDNAAFVTPEQWTAAQDAAIDRGDVAEAQRLRDLHFKASAPNNTIVDNVGMPAHVYHGTESKPFTVFDINAPRVHDLGTYGKGFYFTPNKETATNYGNGKLVFDSYLKLERPYSGNMDVVDNVGNFRNLKELKNYYKQKGIPEKQINAIDWGNFDITDGVNAGDEIMVLKPNQIKSADAVTYDDAGNIIPLSKRDNFNVNDIRYGLIPWILLTLGATQFNDE